MVQVQDRRTGTERSVASRPPIFWVNLAVKAALFGLLLLAVVRPDLPQFAGKAMAGRALTYPLSALVVPIGYWVARRRGWTGTYPYAADILIVLPFLIDTVGNALDLYDTIEWWDDANHLINWMILTAACGQVLLRLPLARLTMGALMVGFGAVTAILWEFAEYFTFIRNSPELETAYTDTLGDLAFGLTGSVIAAWVTAGVLWPRAHRDDSQAVAEVIPR